MRNIVTASILSLAVVVAGNQAEAGPYGLADYNAMALLSPCQESDNDSRWGEAAETECEQYLMGFVHALIEVDAIGPESGMCPPDINTADEVRWAFMRWVHADYSARIKMPAGDALKATLRDEFPCDG